MKKIIGRLQAMETDYVALSFITLFAYIPLLAILIYPDLPAYNSFHTSFSFISYRQTAAVSDFDSSLVARYTFDGVTDDSNGSSHGTANGNPQYADGKIGGAMIFDGTDDYVSVGNILNAPSAFSISVWLKPINLTSSKGIVSKFSGGNGYFLSTQSSSGSIKPRFVINDTSVIPMASDGELSEGNWTHIVATYNGSEASLYVDGELMVGQVSATPPNSTNSNLLIGKSSGSTSFINAEIDDVRLYDKALTPDEVEDLFDEATPLPDNGPSEPDETPPVISSITSGGITTTGAQIVWSTDEPATSQVEYGLDTSYGSQTSLNSSLTYSHSRSISSLQPNTTYHYRVKSTDGSGNESISGDRTFTTTAEVFVPMSNDDDAITAASCSKEDVEDAIDEAQHGDVVEVPAGTCTWTDSIRITKGVTLKGAGIGNTIIYENTNDSIFRLQTSAGRSYRITGFEFRDGSGRNSDLGGGIINLAGDSDSIRIDNNKFDRPRNRHIRTGGYVRGVSDHNFHYLTGDGTAYQLWHQEWEGGTWGDTSWSKPIYWGTREAWYIEDNYFEGRSGTADGATDTYGGARFVFRYNTLLNTNLPTHGTHDGAGRNRGLRQFEVYSNKITYDPSNSENTFHVRGGTGVYFNNSHYGVKKAVTLHYYRVGSRSCGTFGVATGLSAFDINDKSDGANTPGGAGDGLFYEGVAGPGSGPNKLVVSGANFAKDQWAKFQIYVPNSSENPNGYFATIALSNDSDTIITQANNFENTCPHTFVPGERFEIRRILLGLDQVGAGTSDLLTDKTTNPTPVNLNQQYDPVYAWNNTYDQRLSVKNTLVGGDTVIENIHFINDVCRPGYIPYVYPHVLIQQQDGVSATSVPLNCNGNVPPPIPELPQPPVTATPTPVPTDTTPPVVAINSPLASATLSGTVNIVATASDNVGVEGVIIRVNDTLVADDSVAPYIASLNTTLLPNGPATITAVARDGEENTATASVNVTISNISVSDTTAPTVPTGLKVTADKRDPKITLNWNKSSDNVGVAGYEVYRNNAKYDTTISNSYIDRGVSSQTTYTYYLRAYDAKGNYSTNSEPISVTTPIYTATNKSALLVSVPTPMNTPVVNVYAPTPLPSPAQKVQSVPKVLKFSKSNTVSDPISGETRPFTPTVIVFEPIIMGEDIPIPEKYEIQYVEYEPTDYLNSMVSTAKDFFVGIYERIISGGKKIVDTVL